MLSSDFLDINFEGFCHKSQQFKPKEISVRGANYQDTILLQLPVKFSLLAEENKKTYAWLIENVHGIIWQAGSYDHTFIYSLSSTRSNLDFQTVPFFFQKVPRRAPS